MTPTMPPAAARLRMLHSNALVRLEERIKMTEGGLHIPETAQRQPKLGTVMKVGPGRWSPKQHVDSEVNRDRYHFWPTEVREGDTVYIGPYNGRRVDEALGIDDGHEWWIVETLAGVGMDWSAGHPGDVYLVQKRDGE